jgi:hypothetical protein
MQCVVQMCGSDKTCEVHVEDMHTWETWHVLRAVGNAFILMYVRDISYEYECVLVFLLSLSYNPSFTSLLY